MIFIKKQIKFFDIISRFCCPRFLSQVFISLCTTLIITFSDSSSSSVVKIPSFSFNFLTDCFKLNMNLHTQSTARKILVFLLNHSNLKMLSSVFEYGVSSFTCSACVISCGLFTNSSFAEALSRQSIVGH